MRRHIVNVLIGAAIVIPAYVGMGLLAEAWDAITAHPLFVPSLLLFFLAVYLVLISWLVGSTLRGGGQEQATPPPPRERD